MKSMHPHTTVFRSRRTVTRSDTSDSFGAKVALLVIDKLVIGAVIALALFVYDRWRTHDQRRFEERLSIAAASIDKARLVRDLLPSITDPHGNLAARAAMISALHRAYAIDEDTSIGLLVGLLEEGLSEDTFVRTASSTMPRGIVSLARIYTLNESLLLDNRRPIADVTTESADVGSEMERGIARRLRHLAYQLIDAFESEFDSAYADDAALAEHLGPLYSLLRPVYSDEMEDVAKVRSHVVKDIINMRAVMTSTQPWPGIGVYPDDVRVLAMLRVRTGDQPREALRNAVIQVMRDECVRGDDIYLRLSASVVLELAKIATAGFDDATHEDAISNAKLRHNAMVVLAAAFRAHESRARWGESRPPDIDAAERMLIDRLNLFSEQLAPDKVLESSGGVDEELSEVELIPFVLASSGTRKAKAAVESLCKARAYPLVLPVPERSRLDVWISHSRQLLHDWEASGADTDP